jgi:hypothetical protein
MTLASLGLAPVLFRPVDSVGHAGGVVTGILLGAALEWSQRRVRALVFEVGSVVMVAAAAGGLVAAGLHWAPPESFFERFLEDTTPGQWTPTRSDASPTSTVQPVQGLRDAPSRTGSHGPVAIARGYGWAAKTFSHRFPPGLAR